MAQSADAKDPDSLVCCHCCLQGGIHCCTSTLKRSGMLATHAVGDPVYKRILACVVLAEGAVVKVSLATDDALIAENIPAGEAVLAVAASVPMEASASSVTDVEASYRRANCLDDANTLVPQGQGGTEFQIGQITVTNSRVSDADEDVVGPEFGNFRGGGDDCSITGPEDGVLFSDEVGRRHVDELGFSVQIGTGK